MNARTHRLLRIALGCALVGLSCKENVGLPAPLPGNLYARLVTPNATDAAIRVTLTGPGIGAIVPSGSRLLYSFANAENARGVAVFGDLTTGDIFAFAVPDVHHPELYTLTLVQVATNANALRLPLTGYTLSIHD